MMIDTPSPEDIKSGQAVYTPKSLPFYDLYVTKFSNRFVWKCGRKTLIQFFKENISNNHLDIGVGTGYFLQQLHLIPAEQRLGLLDMNEHCLKYAKEQLKQFHPETYKQNVFEPFTGITRKFDSVSLNYVLHCLPGTLSQKGIVFDHIKAVLNSGGKLFGTTILGTGVKKNFLARKLMVLYNKQKLFSNIHDNKELLQNELQKRFSQVEIKVQGCVALFIAE